MVASKIVVFCVLFGLLSASPIHEPYTKGESSEDLGNENVQSKYEDNEPYRSVEGTNMDQLFQAMVEMQDELLDDYTENNSTEKIDMVFTWTEDPVEDSDEDLEDLSSSLKNTDLQHKDNGSTPDGLMPYQLLPIVKEKDDKVEIDPNQSRAGFNPFVQGINATDDLIVISPSFGHFLEDAKKETYEAGSGNLNSTDEDDEFSINLMNVLAEDENEDSKQETILPFFPIFGGPILNSVVESLQRLQNQVQNMWNVYGNFNTSLLETLPNNYKNGTSLTKVVDGSVVQVNETVNKEVINGVPHLFHIKVVAVKPQNETMKHKTTSPTFSDSPSSVWQEGDFVTTSAHAQLNKELSTV